MLATRAPLKYFPPLVHPETLCILIATCAWTAVVVYMHDNHYSIGWDTSYAVTIMSGTLSILLPMRLTAAMSKSQQGMANFNALCGDLQAMAWHVLSETPERDGWSDIITVLSVIPGAVKHHFRGDLASDRLKDYNGNYYIGSAPGKKTDRICGKDDIEFVDALLYTLMDETQDYAQKHPKDIDYKILSNKWEHIYASWGTLGSMFSYRPPPAIDYIRNTVLLMYCVFLPFSIHADGYGSVGLVFVIIYFFVGLNLSVNAAGMPFASGRRSTYQTVTATEKATVKAITRAASSDSAEAVISTRLMM